MNNNATDGLLPCYDLFIKTQAEKVSHREAPMDNPTLDSDDDPEAIDWEVIRSARSNRDSSASAAAKENIPEWNTWRSFVKENIPE